MIANRNSIPSNQVAKVPLISVLIPSYNSQKTIHTCLKSILDQQTNFKYEVIMVDSSNDLTPSIVKKDFPEVHFIHFDKKTPRGEVLNIGIKRAKGKIISCIDSDCVVANKDWINNIVDYHKRHDVVGARILNGNPRSLIGWSIFLMEFCEWLPAGDRVMKMLLGFNVSYKRKIFEKYGFFPDGASLNEDLILHSRIKESFSFASRITVKHLNRTGFLEVVSHCFKLGRGAALARKQYPEIPGSFFAKYPVLIPLLPFVRFLLSGYRSLQANYLPIFLLVSPLIFINSVSYSIGFLISSLRK